MGAKLAGATVLPSEGTQVSSAGEFAAYWNAATPERREEMVASIQQSIGAAIRCFTEDHAARIEHLDSEQQWAVRIPLTGGGVTYMRQHDRAACERFITTPPAWYSPSAGELVTVSRVVSQTEWTEAS